MNITQHTAFSKDFSVWSSPCQTRYFRNYSGFPLRLLKARKNHTVFFLLQNRGEYKPCKWEKLRFDFFPKLKSYSHVRTSAWQDYQRAASTFDVNLFLIVLFFCVVRIKRETKSTVRPCFLRIFTPSPGFRISRVFTNINSYCILVVYNDRCALKCSENQLVAFEYIRGYWIRNVVDRGDMFVHLRPCLLLSF